MQGRNVRQRDIKDTCFSSRRPEYISTSTTSEPTSQHAPAVPVQLWNCTLAPPTGTSVIAFAFQASRDGAGHGMGFW